ncbi:MAG: glycerol-3-phosphate acyltransferase [Ilumatobacteraceae bacterium]
MSSASSTARLVAAAAVGYLLGTVPSADVAARLAHGGTIDLRASGSNNPGALNAAQQLGTRWGVAVLIADAMKGSAAGVIGKRIAGGTGAYAAATLSIAGHIWPMWSRFRGGKGVATSAGACLAIFPAYFPIDAGVAALGAVGSRNAETSVRVSAAVWTLSAALWWRRGWPNLWGPRPTAGLPMFAAVSSAMIVVKFASARRTAATG